MFLFESGFFLFIFDCNGSVLDYNENRCMVARLQFLSRSARPNNRKQQIWRLKIIRRRKERQKRGQEPDRGELGKTRDNEDIFIFGYPLYLYAVERRDAANFN